MGWYVTGGACKVLAPDKVPLVWGKEAPAWLYQGLEQEAEADKRYLAAEDKQLHLAMYASCLPEHSL